MDDEKNGEKSEYHDELGRFKPGNPGGPGRPPKDRSITERLRQIMLEPYDPNDQDGPTYLEEFARSLVQRAIKGSDNAAKAIMDRLEGKPVQPIETPDNKPIDAKTIIYAGGAIEVVDGDDDDLDAAEQAETDDEDSDDE